ncbi:hypothetical protein CBM2592_A160105 [Cupriavidus taiwanensis]|nr:hypothetical protein CBM2588_A120184 [Cupriavidus taiwanensis]SOY45722.1 hypothetical protein CBM2592_A160105 [Cupriavidus taiwanensis]SOY81167.1 hypothetical protein CBM2591_A190105 [Cupriavidus taiwanensis]SOZ53942.1 hypothetical protein CBM2617_A170016 [Cupriavidus taiwanensis]SOZ77727.1 hypothetical protein CBM2622_A150183 [Cupriavidus taiwanensis]
MEMARPNSFSMLEHGLFDVFVEESGKTEGYCQC